MNALSTAGTPARRARHKVDDCARSRATRCAIASSFALSACISHSVDVDGGPSRPCDPSRPQVTAVVSLVAREQPAEGGEPKPVTPGVESWLRTTLLNDLYASGRFVRGPAPHDESDLTLALDVVWTPPTDGLTVARYTLYLVPTMNRSAMTLRAQARTRDGRSGEYALGGSESALMWLPLLPIGLLQITTLYNPGLEVPEDLVRLLVDHLEQDGLLTPRAANERAAPTPP